jgi:hypothetical protein
MPPPDGQSNKVRSRWPRSPWSASATRKVAQVEPAHNRCSVSMGSHMPIASVGIPIRQARPTRSWSRSPPEPVSQRGKLIGLYFESREPPLPRSRSRVCGRRFRSPDRTGIGSTVLASGGCGNAHRYARPDRAHRSPGDRPVRPPPPSWSACPAACPRRSASARPRARSVGFRSSCSSPAEGSEPPWHRSVVPSVTGTSLFSGVTHIENYTPARTWTGSGTRPAAGAPPT